MVLFGAPRNQIGSTHSHSIVTLQSDKKKCDSIFISHAFSYRNRRTLQMRARGIELKCLWCYRYVLQAFIEFEVVVGQWMYCMQLHLPFVKIF